MLKSIINKILDTGVLFQENLLDKRKVRLINILYLISIVNAEFYSIIYCFIDCKGLLQLIVNSNIFVIFCILGIYLNKKKQILASQHLLCIILTGITFVNTYFFVGVKPYIHFYYLLFAVSPLLVWRLRQIIPIFIYFTINSLLFIYTQFFLQPTSNNLQIPDGLAVFIGILSVFSTFVSLLATLWINLNQIEENEKHLNNQAEQMKTMMEETNKKNREILLQKNELNLLNKELSGKNQSLTELNNTKDKFFSIISHDLKSPFNSILGFSETLVHDFDEYELTQIKQMVLNIYNSTEQTYKLIENLLEWSMNQSGKIIYNPHLYNLSLLINDTVLLLKNNALKKEIEIKTCVDESVNIYVDKDMFSTIIRNLLSNAIKYTKKNGMVKIEVQEQSDFVNISVIDNGIGISNETQKNIFNITQKTNIPGTENESGTGLGLLLCKEFVEKHHGTISVESKPDKGSCFTVKIPKKNI